MRVDPLMMVQKCGSGVAMRQPISASGNPATRAPFADRLKHGARARAGVHASEILSRKISPLPPTLQPVVTVASMRSCNIEDALCICKAAKHLTTNCTETRPRGIQLSLTIKVEIRTARKTGESNTCGISTSLHVGFGCVFSIHRRMNVHCIHLRSWNTQDGPRKMLQAASLFAFDFALIVRVIAYKRIPHYPCSSYTHPPITRITPSLM